MEFNFRDLVDLLGIDAPVHFTPKDELNRQDYVFCKYMGEDECAAITAANRLPKNWQLWATAILWNSGASTAGRGKWKPERNKRRNTPGF